MKDFEKKYYFNAGDAATLLGISRETLKQYAVKSEKVGKNKMYDCRLLVAERISRVENKSGSKDLNESNRRLTEAKAKLAEIELAEKKREMIPSEKVTLVWSGIITAFRSKLLAVPGRLGRILGLTDENVKKVKDVIIEILDELSKKDLDKIFSEYENEDDEEDS